MKKARQRRPRTPAQARRRAVKRCLKWAYAAHPGHRGRICRLLARAKKGDPLALDQGEKLVKHLAHQSLAQASHHPLTPRRRRQLSALTAA